MEETIQNRAPKSVFKIIGLVLFALLPQTVLAKSPATVWLDLGYRQDSNNWTIASPGGSPNVLSYLAWEDLEIFQLRGRFDMFWKDSFYLRGTLGYGWIMSGENQDSDYLYDNSQGEYSRSINDAGDGNTTDAMIGIGKPFRVVGNSRNTLIIPMLGFSHHMQHLTMKNGLQVVSDPALYPTGLTFPPAGTRIKGLNSSYSMQWYGLWFGADVQLYPTDKTEGFLRLEYHTVNYYGEGNWNLTEKWKTPRSFSDWDDGNGRVVRLGWNITLEKEWKLGVELDYQHWTTDGGTRRVYLLNGNTIDTGFNGANRTSSAILISIGCDCLGF